MKLPISWLKDFIDLDGLSVEDIARKLTLAGLEVDGIQYVGLPMPVYGEGEKHEFKTSGIAWDREKIVVAEIYEVKPHPNADRFDSARSIRRSATTSGSHRRAEHFPFEGHRQISKAHQGCICQRRLDAL